MAVTRCDTMNFNMSHADLRHYPSNIVYFTNYQRQTESQLRDFEIQLLIRGA